MGEVETSLAFKKLDTGQVFTVLKSQVNVASISKGRKIVEMPEELALQLDLYALPNAAPF